MTVFETNYVLITFDKQNELGLITWKGKCTSEEYREAFNTMLKFQEGVKISRYITDIRKQGVINPTERKWFETYVFPRAVELGVKVSAVIFDGNAFKKYYINVILSVINKFNVPIKIFNTLDDAKTFVMSK